MYNLMEYSNNYSKTSGSLWHMNSLWQLKDEPNDDIANSESFKSKVKIARSTPAGANTKDVKIIVTLKHLSNFWRFLEMPFINCEVRLLTRNCKSFVNAIQLSDLIFINKK